MAIIYNQDISKGISLNESQISNLNLGISNICGYFHKTALERLLSLPECVGIRFYNVLKRSDNSNGDLEHTMVACAVKSDGYEINGGNDFYISEPIFGDVNKEMIPISHEEAQMEVNKTFPIEIKRQILTFFSKRDLENILLAPDPNNPNHLTNLPQGLTIYYVKYINEGEIEIVGNQLEEFKSRDSFKTMIAFRTNLVNNEIPLIPDIKGNIMSLYPCPGHCIWKEHTSENRDDDKLNVIPNTSMVGAPDKDDPYLFEWTKEDIVVGLGEERWED